MGELHLEVYVERMKREYNCEVTTGAPQVAYRESITQRGDFNYTHKKQTGGSGQYGRVAGFMEPDSEKDYEFVEAIKGGAIPNEYIPSCDKGFQKAMKEGSLIGAPIVGVKITINDGQYHPVDSNDNAFQIAAIGAFREGYMKAKPVILEPIMKVQMTAPTEFQGNLFGLINQRRGVIVDSTDENNTSTVNAEVPLSEMFGFSTILRSSTQGKGEFTMEFLKYGKVPNAVADELIAKHKEAKAAGKTLKDYLESLTDDDGIYKTFLDNRKTSRIFSERWNDVQYRITSRNDEVLSVWEDAKAMLTGQASKATTKDKQGNNIPNNSVNKLGNLIYYYVNKQKDTNVGSLMFA
jgi:elongation factor G